MVLVQRECLQSGCAPAFGAAVCRVSHGDTPSCRVVLQPVLVLLTICLLLITQLPAGTASAAKFFQFAGAVVRGQGHITEMALFLCGHVRHLQL